MFGSVGTETKIKIPVLLVFVMPIPLRKLVSHCKARSVCVCVFVCVCVCVYSESVSLSVCKSRAVSLNAARLPVYCCLSEPADRYRIQKIRGIFPGDFRSCFKYNCT